MIRYKQINGQFEKNYFTGWFKHAVGNYTRKDLTISMNWFAGWINYINKYVPIENGSGKNALEIGCSIGGVSKLLKNYGYDVTATDVSNYSINRAKKLSPDITFINYDVQSKPKFGKKFDLIIAFEVIEHLQYPEKAIKYICSMLNKGGCFVATSPYPKSWIYDDPTHINVRYPGEWMRIFRKNEFSRNFYFSFSLMPFFYRFSKRFHIILPFTIQSRYINSPFVYVGCK